MHYSRRLFVGSLVSLATPGILQAAASFAEKEDKKTDLTQFVDPFIGTGGFGHTFPAATMPFGSVQLGPDTGDHGWRHCSGYHYDDPSILGFSHTHLSGTGVGDMLDFRVAPGYTAQQENHASPQRFVANFRHADEHAEPGFYRVDLTDPKVKVELTATERTGFHQYTFADSKPCLLIDLQPVWRFEESKPEEAGLVLWSSLTVGSDSISASRSTDAWAKGRIIHAHMKFSHPFSHVDVYQDGRLLESAAAAVSGKQLMCVVHFDCPAHTTIGLKAGISGVSVEGAASNLADEIPQWNFSEVKQRAHDRWQRELSRVMITSDDVRRKKIFYTGLYHMMLAPTLFDDVDGRYTGMDGKVHTLPAGAHNYSTFSLWDTYRALHPMFTLIMPDRVPDFVNCIIRQSTESPHGVTVWPLQGKETGCMVGYHSAPVVAEALVKGFPGIDVHAAYEAFQKRAEADDYRGLGVYRKLGYVPCDVQDESVSKTCDYAYDDWCVAAIARHAGDTKLADELTRRSHSYRNVYNAETGFFRPRYSNGTWAAPFNPKSITVTKWRDYTEANAWETTFLVQHDGPGLAQLLGGKKALEQKLDALFSQSPDLPPDVPPDMTGMIGQYCQGNEPCHHIVYFYNVAGAPYKAQRRVRSILNEMYSDQPDGMSGNEDCGQMSAWFCMNALGFYAVDPVSGQYDVGTPMFDQVVLKVGNDQTLTIRTKRESARSTYVKSLSLNNQVCSDWKLEHRDLAGGGELLFELTDQPPVERGNGPERSEAPHTTSTLQL